MRQIILTLMLMLNSLEFCGAQENPVNSSVTRQELGRLLSALPNHLNCEDMKLAIRQLGDWEKDLDRLVQDSLKHGDDRVLFRVRNGFLMTTGAAVIAFVGIGLISAVGKTGPYSVFGSEKIFALSFVAQYLSIAVTALGLVGSAGSEAVVLLLSNEEAANLRDQLDSVRKKLTTFDTELKNRQQWSQECR